MMWLIQMTTMEVYTSELSVISWELYTRMSYNEAYD